MTLEKNPEGDSDLSPPIPRATLLGHVSYLRSAPDLLKLNQYEATCRPGRGGSLSVSPGTKLTVSRASSPQPRGISQNSLKQDNTVGRSQSMRTAQRPRSLEPNNRFRQRIASIPVDMALQLDPNLTTRSSSDQSLLLPVELSDFERLRNFSVTSKGVINRGDSFRSKSRSNHSISSVGSQPPHSNITPPSTPNLSSVAFPGAETPDVPPVIITESVRYRVLITGSPDVGISSLTSQFLTSEYICAYETSQAEENEKSVTIVLNGQETELLFVEHSLLDIMSQILPETSNLDAFAVVYSVTNKHSFQQAKNLLQQICETASINNKAVVLVGNKSDLVRLRVVTSDEGRAAATSFNCKFIETSAGINHHVDELLVGILTQIRLKLQHQEKISEKKEKPKNHSSSVCTGKAKGFIKRILRKASTKSKSCDNLHVL
ncbi:GTP-binding protein RAD-like isoform X2 [Limulus polyphemus]|uniref:GTP-binding protein RAD-like isoform X2 n=1 Tax=Limulus polyphemus TaxID=6850 RepID=A0ABM1SMG9_LIMPO|nr:GTP-binding protein RAD-like isoform X2 [Limulus polyphemus]